MRNFLGALLVLAVPFGVFSHLSGAWSGGLAPGAAVEGSFWIRMATIAACAGLVLAAYRVRSGLLGPGLAAALALCAYPAMPDAAASPFSQGRLWILGASCAVLLVLSLVLPRAAEGGTRATFLLAAATAVAAGMFAHPGVVEFGAAALGPQVLPAAAFAVLAGETALLLVRRGGAGSPARRALVAGLSAVLLGAAAIGQFRALAWRDGRSFWERAVEEAPRSPPALGALAGACADAGDRAGAAAHLRGFAEAAAGGGGRGFGGEARRLGAEGVARAARLVLEGRTSGGVADAGDAESSEAALRAAMEFAPGCVPVLVALSELRLALGDFREPIRLLEEAVARDRGAADAWGALARARLAAGRIPEAMVAARTAAGLRPREKRFIITWADGLLTLGRGGEALEALRGALGPKPPFDPLVAHAYADAELRLARADISAGRRGAARRKLLSAGQVDPGNGACAELLADLDRQMEAERPGAEKRLSPGPDGKILPDDWLFYATWLCRWGDFEGAEPHFRRMLDLLGTTPAVHFQYGHEFWEERGSAEGVEKAVDAYRQAIALDGGYAEAWNRLWQCQRRLNRIEEAVFAARKFVELAPSHPDAAEALQFLGGR